MTSTLPATCADAASGRFIAERGAEPRLLLDDGELAMAAWWSAGPSRVARTFVTGAKDMVGLADEGYLHGMVMTNFDFIGTNDKPALLAFSTPEWLETAKTALAELGYKVHTAATSGPSSTRFSSRTCAPVSPRRCS